MSISTLPTASEQARAALHEVEVLAVVAHRVHGNGPLAALDDHGGLEGGRIAGLERPADPLRPQLAELLPAEPAGSPTVGGVRRECERAAQAVLPVRHERVGLVGEQRRMRTAFGRRADVAEQGRSRGPVDALSLRHIPEPTTPY